MVNSKPKVIIIGAGFAGMNAARTFADQPVEVLLIDRYNYHTFTPLLYQVATCGLDASEISYPVRSIFRKTNNIHILLGEVVEIDETRREVHTRVNGHCQIENYDYLVVAAGSATNYFGMTSAETYGYDLKSLRDAVRLRNHVLKLFELAAWEEDPVRRDAMLTLVVVGGGPTGLETAGALHELYNYVLEHDFHGGKRFNARVILVEMQDRLLLPYPESLQKAAQRQLESMGVEVMLGERVETVEEDHIILASGERIDTYTMVWAAGVKASPLAELFKVELKRGGRMPVEPTLRVIGKDDIYAIGDIAYLEDENGKPYPQLIPPAQQMGKLAAKNILRHIKGEPEEAFKYSDRGMMATIGRSRAVAWPFYKIKLTGWFAWVTWLGLHLLWLMGFRNRLNVFVNWVWNYITYDRSVRIIVEKTDVEIAERVRDYEPLSVVHQHEQNDQREAMAGD